jgi:hypothetical protein
VSAPTVPILLRWNPTEADVAELMAVHREQAGGLARVVPYLGALVMLALGALLLWAGLLVAATIAALGAVFLVLVGTRAQARAAWRNPLLRQPAAATVGPDALTLSSTGAAAYSTTWQWSAFDRLVETERLFVLLGRPSRGRALLATYLPKRAAADVDQLRALLTGAVRPR